MLECKDCKANCCSHVAIEIDKPVDNSDFENIRWYVAHKNIRVWVNDKEEWYIEFLTRCQHLNKEYRCMIYEKRPEICKNYNPKNCVATNLEHEEEFAFENIEDVDNYINNLE